MASPDEAAVGSYAERHYEWWQSVWSAREATSISGRDSVQTATLEYGPIEVSAECGTYVGYTPAVLGGADGPPEPVAGVGLV